MLSLLLVLQLDIESTCARFRTLELPAAAAAAVKACADDETYCLVTLAEKYANGDGVARSLDIAESLLCRAEDDLAQAELEGMLEHVQRLRTGQTSAPLAFCDHATSGYASTYCAHVNWERMMPLLDARLAKAPVPNALRTAGLSYVRKESERISAFSIAGTGYSAIVLGSEVEQKERLVSQIETWSSKHAPSASAAELKRADDDLNAAYREARAQLDSDDEIMADWPRLLRDAQRAWIAYRDAFAKFYVDRWKGRATPEALRREIITALTRDRVKELRPD